MDGTTSDLITPGNGAVVPVTPGNGASLPPDVSVTDYKLIKLFICVVISIVYSIVYLGRAR